MSTITTAINHRHKPATPPLPYGPLHREPGTGPLKAGRILGPPWSSSAR